MRRSSLVPELPHLSHPACDGWAPTSSPDKETGEDVGFDIPAIFPYHPPHQQGYRPVFAYL